MSANLLIPYLLTTYPPTLELPMSFTIVPNPNLNRGFLLILTDRCGNKHEVECHNRATAEWEARRALRLEAQCVRLREARRINIEQGRR